MPALERAVGSSLVESGKMGQTLTSSLVTSATQPGWAEGHGHGREGPLERKRTGEGLGAEALGGGGEKERRTVPRVPCSPRGRSVHRETALREPHSGV